MYKKELVNMLACALHANEALSSDDKVMLCVHLMGKMNAAVTFNTTGEGFEATTYFQERMRLLEECLQQPDRNGSILHGSSVIHSDIAFSRASNRLADLLTFARESDYVSRTQTETQSQQQSEQQQQQREAILEIQEHVRNMRDIAEADMQTQAIPAANPGPTPASTLGWSTASVQEDSVAGAVFSRRPVRLYERFPMLTESDGSGEI